ncbi:MAG: DUF6306 domain-containing protein [Porticoccaceae bacterium]
MTTPLHSPVCDLLGCRYPLVLAGMGGVARAELVGAVTQAGGFGFLGMVREPVGVLTRTIRRLQGIPSPNTGVFYDKAMAITGIPARLAFLNRGQAWVVRKLQALLPTIRDAALTADLAAMLAAHQ